VAGTPHDVLVATLREQPTLLAALVHALTGRTLAPGLEPVDSTVRFVKVAEVRPDVLLAQDQRWAIVEVQNERDPDKQRRWVLAAAVLLDQVGTLGDVIVITAHPSVATWALTVAHLETPLGTKLALTPVVLHVSPELIDRLLTERQPELAVVAAWAVSHRHGPAAQRVVERAIELTAKLPEALQDAQMNAILALLSARMLAWLQETQMNPDKIPMSPAALKFKAHMKAEGRAEGQAEGRADGKREALLELLESRGLSATKGERALIQGCTDPAMLGAWIVQAATARSVAEVLATKPQPGAAKRRPRAARRPAQRA
jgi:hypothetical protein